MRDHASPVQSVQKDYCAANVSNVRQKGTARNVGALLSLTCQTYTHAHALGAHCRESYHCTSAQVDPPKQVDIFVFSKKNACNCWVTTRARSKSIKRVVNLDV